MADNKSNSMSSKVATPRTASTPPQPDTLDTLSKAIGGRIKITTAGPLPQTFEGSLFTACPVLNVVAINTHASDASTQAGNYRVLPFSRIQSFELVTLPSNGTISLAAAQPAIGPVDMKRMQERLDARVQKLKEEVATRGKGVTKQGQAIFDALKRVNIPIRWHDKQMIAYDAVIISPPYTLDDCKGSKDKQQVLNQVRRVLEGETRKLKAKEERERSNVNPPAVQRKGG